MGVQAPPELLAAAGLVSPPPEALETPGGAPPWNTTMGYEQLLSIQQQQHELAMQHRETEIAHLKSYINMVEVKQPADTKHVAAVLQTKDEEAALMMAAKHKELELMAGLLQLREQQIEDFRQLCEAQRVEIQQLKRMLSGARDLPDDGQRVSQRGSPSPKEDSGRELLHVATSPSASSLVAQEEQALTQREVRRLRLRMEELEAAVAEQHDRGTGLARALESKTERVRALEDQIRSLQTPVGMYADMDQESAMGGPAASVETVPLPVAVGHSAVVGSRLSPPRLVLPPTQGHGHRLPQELEQRPAASFGTNRSGEGGFGGRAAYSATSLSSTQDELPPMSLTAEDQQLRREWQQPHLVGREPDSRPLSAGHHAQRPSAAASSELGEASLPSGQQTYRSAVRMDWGSNADGADAPWGGASEAAETGRQSQELLREMRRLRLQMSELEREAGKRSNGTRRGFAQAAGGVKQQRGGALVQDRLMASASSFGGGSSVDVTGGSAFALAEPITEGAVSFDQGQPRLSPSTSTTALGPAGSSAPALLRSRHASEGTLRSVGSATSLSIAWRSEGRGHEVSSESAGWEYRPHSSGDATDAAVAALVNRPGGRYRGWRALLCRLERGVYLCGTRRIHIRADTAAELIEASDDGGKTWADLEDLMRGAEASQHALLERARDAAGLAA